MSMQNCTHEEEFIVYPGEMTEDSRGHIREDGMRVYCPDCNNVGDYRGFDS
jgi:hypothetical protein